MIEAPNFKHIKMGKWKKKTIPDGPMSEKEIEKLDAEGREKTLLDRELETERELAEKLESAPDE